MHYRPQVMEVVEHLLHHVTDVGLHFAFPSDWGLGTQSALHQCMQQVGKVGGSLTTQHTDCSRPSSKAYSTWATT